VSPGESVSSAIVAARGTLAHTVVLRSGVPLSSSIDDRQGVKRSLVRNADPDDEEGVVEVSL
jgi:hypothetical protein